jgi:hypothetical protein
LILLNFSTTSITMAPQSIMLQARGEKPCLFTLVKEDAGLKSGAETMVEIGADPTETSVQLYPCREGKVRHGCGSGIQQAQDLRHPERQRQNDDVMFS